MIYNSKISCICVFPFPCQALLSQFERSGFMVRSAVKRNDLRVLILCWATYSVAYLCRLNFASALTKISSGLDISHELLGIIPSAYFVVYAIGQLLNGFIGDRVNPYRYIFIALCITASANFFISLSTSYFQILIFWSINGFCQSMFWGSLLRLLSWNFDPSKYKTVATSMSLSSIFASILSWSVLGTVLLDSSWQAYFFIPSLAAMLFLTFWLVLLKRNPNDSLPLAAKKSLTLKDSFRLLIADKLHFLCVLCFCLGFIKEGLAVWAPTIFMQSLGLQTEKSLLYLMVIPIANLVGLIIVRKLLSFSHENTKKTMFLMLAGMGLSAVALVVAGAGFPALNVIFISLLTALANGSIWIVISYLPLAFSARGMVSTIVGVFNFSIYLGASVASVLLGLLLVLFGWIAIPAIWVIFSFFACVLCIGGAGTCLTKRYD